MPKSMKAHSMPSFVYSSCSRTNMWWLKNCCSFSLVKLMQSCSKPLNCSRARNRHAYVYIYIYVISYFPSLFVPLHVLACLFLRFDFLVLFLSYTREDQFTKGFLHTFLQNCLITSSFETIDTCKDNLNKLFLFCLYAKKIISFYENTSNREYYFALSNAYKSFIFIIKFLY